MIKLSFPTVNVEFSSINFPLFAWNIPFDDAKSLTVKVPSVRRTPPLEAQSVVAPNVTSPRRTANNASSLIFTVVASFITSPAEAVNLPLIISIVPPLAKIPPFEVKPSIVKVPLPILFSSPIEIFPAQISLLSRVILPPFNLISPFELIFTKVYSLI